MIKSFVSNGSRRFIVNSFTLHPPNHLETINQRIKMVSVVPRPSVHYDTNISDKNINNKQDDNKQPKVVKKNIDLFQ